VATYQGDANFNGASSPAAGHTVNQLPSATTITAHLPEPSVIGQAITVDVSVSGGGPVPGGSVTVTDQTDSCVATLNQGSGSCVLVPTTSGAKTLTADYAGDAIYLASVSPGVAHQVDAFGPVDPASSTATVPDGAVGNVTSMLIVTRDQYGNQVGAGGAAVSVIIIGANSGTATVTDNGDGTYTAAYTPVLPGVDSIVIQVNAIPIPGNPFISVVS
jgi:hypothetical protein